MFEQAGMSFFFLEQAPLGLGSIYRSEYYTHTLILCRKGCNFSCSGQGTAMHLQNRYQCQRLQTLGKVGLVFIQESNKIEYSYKSTT
jgi:hypothetical protein